MPRPRRGFSFAPNSFPQSPFANSHWRQNTITAVTPKGGLALTLLGRLLRFAQGGCMKDIHEVLRQKQAKYAQLGKQIEMLQQAAEKLREVAPLLAENDDEDIAILTDADDSA